MIELMRKLAGFIKRTIDSILNTVSFVVLSVYTYVVPVVLIWLCILSILTLVYFWVPLTLLAIWAYYMEEETPTEADDMYLNI